MKHVAAPAVEWRDASSAPARALIKWQIIASGERIAARGNPIATEGFPAMATDFHIDRTKPKEHDRLFVALSGMR